MHLSKTEIPEVINAPGAIARQVLDFGDATPVGKMTGEYFSLSEGTDITPLLQGLQEDLCQAQHWGYMLEGEVTVSFKDGNKETASAGDLFYWPPGHTVLVNKNAEIILFSPQEEHCKTLKHMKARLEG